VDDAAHEQLSSAVLASELSSSIQQGAKIASMLSIEASARAKNKAAGPI
jgi:hypothetical protein